MLTKDNFTKCENEHFEENMDLSRIYLAGTCELETAQPAQPKSQTIFHKKCPPQDFIKMIVGEPSIANAIDTHGKRLILCIHKCTKSQSMAKNLS